MLIDMIAKVYNDERKKPKTTLTEDIGFVAGTSEIAGRYTVKSVTRRVSYRVRGPKNMTTGNSVNYSTGNFSSIGQIGGETESPNIIDIEV